MEDNLTNSHTVDNISDQTAASVSSNQSDVEKVTDSCTDDIPVKSTASSIDEIRTSVQHNSKEPTAVLQASEVTKNIDYQNTKSDTKSAIKHPNPNLKPRNNQVAREKCASLEAGDGLADVCVEAAGWPAQEDVVALQGQGEEDGIIISFFFLKNLYITTFINKYETCYKVVQIVE